MRCSGQRLAVARKRGRVWKRHVWSLTGSRPPDGGDEVLTNCAHQPRCGLRGESDVA